jgi:hypothetical protein
MLAPPTFPEWLPPTVALEAQRILNADTADAALVLRLATEKQMDAVWRVLKKCEPLERPQPSALADLMNERADVPLPPDPDALTLFFWCAYTLAWLGVAVGHISSNDLPIALYRLEASRLRLSAANLRKLKLQYGVQVEEGWYTDDHIRHIEDAAKLCDENADVFGKLKAAEAQMVVERVHGNREERAYVRMLAVEARKLFGKPALYRTLATVASVALMKRVTDVQVRKWCASLGEIT